MIVNVSLNSGLPLLESKDTLYQRSPTLNRMFFGADYTTVEVSIAHVDFILAKIFLGVVEEWFKTVDLISRPSWVTWLTYNHELIESVFSQFGRIGISVFIATYVYTRDNQEIHLKQFGYALSLAILVWVFISTIIGIITKVYSKSMAATIIPSVLLITDGDKNHTVRS